MRKFCPRHPAPRPASASTCEGFHQRSTTMLSLVQTTTSTSPPHSVPKLCPSPGEVHMLSPEGLTNSSRTDMHQKKRFCAAGERIPRRFPLSSAGESRAVVALSASFHRSMRPASEATIPFENIIGCKHLQTAFTAHQRVRAMPPPTGPYGQTLDGDKHVAGAGGAPRARRIGLCISSFQVLLTLSGMEIVTHSHIINHTPPARTAPLNLYLILRIGAGVGKVEGRWCLRSVSEMMHELIDAQSRPSYHHHTASSRGP
jgi:hypothetical protein